MFVCVLSVAKLLILCAEGGTHTNHQYNKKMRGSFLFLANEEIIN